MCGILSLNEAETYVYNICFIGLHSAISKIKNALNYALRKVGRYQKPQPKKTRQYNGKIKRYKMTNTGLQSIAEKTKTRTVLKYGG